MTTATATITPQKRFAAFNTIFKPGLVTIVAADGAIELQTGDSSMIIGDYDGDPVAFRITNGKSIAKYVRTAKSKADIVATVNNETKLVLDCEQLGPMVFSGKKYNTTTLELDSMGALVHEIAAEDVQAASEIISRSDPESLRYTLACVLFTDQYAVCCDGRRLARMTLSKPIEGRAMVHTNVVKFAAKFNEDILYLKDRVASGETVHRHIEGRYPNWEQAIPETDTATELDVAAVRKLAEAKVAAVKIEDDGKADPYGVTVALLPDLSVMLDARYLLDALGTLTQVTVSWCADKQSKLLTCPVVFESNEKPNWLEVIMPMAKGR